MVTSLYLTTSYFQFAIPPPAGLMPHNPVPQKISLPSSCVMSHIDENVWAFDRLPH